MNSQAAAGAETARTIDIVNAGLKRRYAAERRFRAAGLFAVLLGLSFVAMLLVSIVGKGYTAFWQTYIQLPIGFAQEVIDPDGELADQTLSSAERNRVLLRANFTKLARDALSAEFPSITERREKRQLTGLLSPGAPLQLRDIVAEDAAVVGSERRVWLLADDDVDMFMKGRSTPVAADPGAGAAVPSGVAGRIEISAEDDAFADVRARVQAYVERAAARTAGDVERLEDRLAGILRERERIVGELVAAGEGSDAAAALQRRIADLDARRAALERQAAEGQEALRSLERRRADGLLGLDDDMPSFLVAINGGMAKITAVAADKVGADVMTPLASADPAEAGAWRLIELKLPESERRLNDRQIAWILQLQEGGMIEKRFNSIFLTHGTSREPELAGIAAALVGSMYTLMLTLLFSFPIAVGAAVYLEEFAPKNRWTDLIEVNINNLAAVPSIVFGLLGLAVFINFFGIPRSTPLVAAMVLTLMTLPTIIIASRAALKSVPPSIREAALGVGASPLQTQLHHVLPLALPGMLTGTIIGMAQALGETAPLLMIGLIAFIVDVPGGITDPATLLPVQIFMWADSPERGFVERTSAAIMVLLGFLILMNLAAVLLRRKFERRW